MDTGETKAELDSSERNSRLQDLLIHEYGYLTGQFISNEEMGEKRVSLFLTLTTGLGAAVIVAHDKASDNTMPQLQVIVLAITVVWYALGYSTFLRILKRNAETDRLKRQLAQIRIWFVEEADGAGRTLLPYDPYAKSIDTHSDLKVLQTGGYAELIALINCMVAFAFGYVLVIVLLSVVYKMKSLLWIQLWSVAGGMALAWFSLTLLRRVAQKRYKDFSSRIGRAV